MAPGTTVTITVSNGPAATPAARRARPAAVRQARATRATRDERRVAVLMGGRSSEHEVSLASAEAVIAALDPTRYEVVPVLIAPRRRLERRG